MSLAAARLAQALGDRGPKQMKLPSKRLLLLSIGASLLGGVAMAAYELNNLHQAIAVSHKIADSVAAGLGGGEPSQLTTTVDVSLCFGLISLGRVGNPYLVIAVGDFILGTLITAFAIALVYTLIGAFRRPASRRPKVPVTPN